MSAHKIVTRCLQQLDHIILGKTQQTKLAMCCLLARGHLLIEDLPGMGKTTLSHALASALGLSYRRIQFTNDLLPGDLLGTNIFDKNDGRFHFHPGPIFSNVILADEINRAPPKTQSALLEAMEEHQVTIEGTTRPLPEPFFVIGTQNPSEQAGTYPLPESQLDRFMMRLSLGYPDESAEKKLLMGTDRRKILASTEGVLNPELLLKLQHHGQGHADRLPISTDRLQPQPGRAQSWSVSSSGTCIAECRPCLGISRGPKLCYSR
jgi:MoxR-like ATPase